MAIRETDILCGHVRGVAAGNPAVTVFKGIPYAEAPTGENRWRPPAPKEPWQGTFEAVRFGNICPQSLPQPGTFYYREFFSTQKLEKHSEDCLQLNVWTPAESAGRHCPVLVFIHGGAFQTNYSFAPQFDGEAMAAQGIVVATINYRLGLFGFLAHPELSAESPEGLSGNYGLMDQILALKWVRENISAFGGDPDRITISGGSAGANSVLFLSMCPLTKGWLKGAIMQSGPLLENNLALKEAESLGRGLLERCGICSIAEARKMDASVLCQYGPDLDKGDSPFIQPCIDGKYLMESALDALRGGRLHDIAYLVGCAKDEACSMRNRFRATSESIGHKLENCYGKYSEEYRKSVRYATPEEVYDFQLNHGFTEDMMAYSCAFCRMQSLHSSFPIYMYHLERQLPGSDTGAFHASEHWYVFQTLNRCWRKFKGADYELAQKMGAYWANFVLRQDPNGSGLPRWEPYQRENPQYMILDVESRTSPQQSDEALKLRVKYYCGE